MKMTFLSRRLLLFAWSFIFLLFSCAEDFLDLKRDQRLVIPNKIADYQAILDNSILMLTSSSHSLGIVGGDEISLAPGVWEALPVPEERNGYIWAQEIYQDQPGRDWNNAYQRIFNANLVLDGLKEITPGPSDQAAYDQVKGSALFFRAFNFFQLAQLFCSPYEAGSAAGKPGIPLRLESDITIKSQRSSIQQTYDQILLDLKEAQALLPERATNKYRPSNVAVAALLSRVYLTMDDYSNCLTYANEALATNKGLMNFREMDLSARYTFPTDLEENREVLLFSLMLGAAVTANSRMNIDTNLLHSYDKHDLRLKAFFYRNTDGRILFKGDYAGTGLLFTGLTVDELYLNKAECLQRLGNSDGAMDVLRELMQNRYDPDTDLNGMLQADDKLALILAERRKELVLRGIRWSDLRRLNREPKFQKNLSREMNGETYSLPPNDVRYTWPIPNDVIDISGMKQNPR